MSEGQNELIKGLQETLKRTEASLLPAVEDHFASTEFKASQGLDFLDVKNSVLLSYLIELTHDLRNRLTGNERQESSFERLQVMKTVIDKSRGLDKKLRYQIDKLLAAGSTASTFAAGSENAEEDPLQFRPDLEAMDDEKPERNDDDNDSSSESGSGDQAVSDGEDDDELAAARATVAKSRDGKSSNTKKKRAGGDGGDDTDNNESSIYRAPRLTAVPYTHDKQDAQAERERRQRRRMRASELAQTLRAQYGEAPEQEDTRGGADLGRQREAARRMAEREKEKRHFEEANMVRLNTTRKEKKEAQRLMREENSNLSAISDVGNLMRESQFGDKRKSVEQSDDVFESTRLSNGKRKRKMIDGDGKLVSSKGRKSVDAKNSLQAELFGKGGSKKGKKRKN